MLTNNECDELHKKVWRIIMKCNPSMIQQLDLVRELAKVIHEFENKKEYEENNNV